MHISPCYEGVATRLTVPVYPRPVTVIIEPDDVTAGRILLIGPFDKPLQVLHVPVVSI